LENLRYGRLESLRYDNALLTEPLESNNVELFSREGDPLTRQPTGSLCPSDRERGNLPRKVLNTLK
jgi:hypothetical protein